MILDARGPMSWVIAPSAAKSAALHLHCQRTHLPSQPQAPPSRPCGFLGYLAEIRLGTEPVFVYHPM